jgi:hypothetical protein
MKSRGSGSNDKGEGVIITMSGKENILSAIGIESSAERNCLA